MINLSAIQIKNDNGWDRACPFPVGYVYISSNSTSPANIYGGTWSEITGGRYFRANETWDTGGSNTISVSQIPSHAHGQGAPYYGDNTGSHTGHTTYWGRYSNTTRPDTYNSGGATVLSNVPRRVRLDKSCLTLVVSTDGLG